MFLLLLVGAACSSGADGTPAPSDVGAGGAGIVDPGTGTAGTTGVAGTMGSGDPVGLPTGGMPATGIDPGTGGTAGSAAGTGGVAGTAGTGGDPMVTPPAGMEPVLPNPSDPCPTLATGTVQIMGQDVQLWVGMPQPGQRGPLYFYWHGTGGSSSNVVFDLGMSVINEITAQGGMVASFSTTTGTGTNTGNGVWYTGDFEMVDVLVKCAVEQLDADTSRIYTGGCSAGGLQVGAMIYGRSSYLAAGMPNSGGVIFPGTLQDPAHVPALITAHGGTSDQVFIMFSQTSATLYNDVVAKGGFAVNCDHGGGHCLSPPEVKAAQWEFLKAHPFGVEPEPYAAGLPASFPPACVVVQ